MPEPTRTAVITDRQRVVCTALTLLLTLFLATTSDAGDAVTTAHQALLARPGDLAAANAYRLAAREAGVSASASDVLGALAKEHRDPGLQAQLALSYLDQLGDTSDRTQKGLLMNRALRAADAAVDADPTDPVALYARGLTRLVWPSHLRHAQFASDDLEECLLAVAAQQAPSPVLARLLVAIGDAKAKLVRPVEAQRAYARALKISDDERAQARADLPIDALRDRVDAELSLDHAPDTDVTFLLELLDPGQE